MKKSVQEIKKRELSNIPTNRLIEEIKEREGVEAVWMEPETKDNKIVTGPILILIVTD